MPKGRVMLISNSIKVAGCLLMLFGTHPLLSYAIVGLGAAAYSPAKYGILTELLPASQLVKANGWIEGLTIASIILGVLLGGQLVGQTVAPWLLGFDFPLIDFGIDSPPEAAISMLIFVYLVAAWFNTHTLIWGVAGNLRFIVLAWAAAALGYTVTQASALQGVVAIGMAVGAVVASLRMRLEDGPRVIPLGIGMGVLIILLIFIDNVWIAAPFLIMLGTLGGFLVVPMNALLQHRGHNLMGAGRSIAVQNFNEQACILALGAAYSLSAGLGVHTFAAITGFGLVVATVMWLIKRWHASNCIRHRAEVDHLIAIARNDNLHG
jgi:MFS family permease